MLTLPAVPGEVGELACPERLRSIPSEDEQDRIRDVALAGLVGPRDRRETLEERDRDLSPERLEVLHLDLFQKQGLTCVGEGQPWGKLPLPIPSISLWRPTRVGQRRGTGRWL